MEYGNGVERTLGKILATQELILKQLETHTDRLDKHIQEDKIIVNKVNKIENRMSYLAGWAVAAIAGFTLLSDLVLTKIGFK